MLKKLYQQLKKIPFLKTLPLRLRETMHAFVMTRIKDEIIPLRDQLKVLQKSETDLHQRYKKLQQANQELKQIYNDLQQRQEYIRLEFFYELTHRTNGNFQIKDNEGQTQQAIILNQSAWDKANKENNIRFNIGCGHKIMQGYLNVDQRKLPDVDIQTDIMTLPVEQGMADEICSAHLIEHFTKENLTRNILPYWKACLKDKGILRIIAPNAEAMMGAYHHKKMDFEQLSTVLMGMQEYDGDFHYTLLSPQSITELLQKIGFHSIEFIAKNRENGLCLEMELTAYK